MSEEQQREIEQKQKSNKAKGAIDPNLPKGALKDSVKVQVSYLSLGKLDGEKVQGAEAGAFKTTREILLQRARELGLGMGMQDGQLHVYARDWLDGYAKAFGEPSGKQRKKEVKAIFEASCITAKTLYLAERKGDPNKLDANTQKPEDPEHTYKVPETKDGIIWLEGCASYSRLYEVARMIRDTSQSSNVTKVKAKIADSVVTKMQENVKVANESQSAVVIQAAVDRLHRMPDGDRLLVNQLFGICRRLATSQDLGIKTFAQEIGAKASDMIARIERSKIDNASSGFAKAPVNLTSADVKAPAPAEAATDVAHTETVGKTGTEG